MTPDQELDEKGLRDNIEWYIAMGTAGICCVGSIGEFVSLTRMEPLRLLTALDYYRGIWRLGIPVYSSHHILAATGHNQVETVSIIRVDESGRKIQGSKKTFRL